MMTNDEQQQTPRRIARSGEVQRLVSRSRSTLWRLERDGKFPKRVQLGENSVGYFYDEVLAWLNSLPRADSAAE